MTVTNEIHKSGPNFGDGVNKTFNYGFKIIDATHLKVVRSEDGVPTTLTLDVDYTVSGVGNNAGGQIETTIAPTLAQSITCVRDIPFDQEIDLENQGAYYPETVEMGLDIAAMRDQQLQEQIDRAVRIPIASDPADLDNVIANVLRLSESADNIDAVANIAEDVEIVSDNINSILTAPDAASAAHASEVNAAASAEASAGHAEDAARLVATFGGLLSLYPSKADAVASTIDPAILFIELSGYYAPGDGGGATYRRVADEPSHAGKFQSADGDWWELAEVRPSIAMFGAHGVGDESANINGAIAYCAARRIRELVVPYGVFTADAISNDLGVKLVGDGTVNVNNVKYNSTGDFYDSWCDGLEYLWTAHTLLTTPGTIHKTVLYGDSTVYGAFIGMPDNRLPDTAQPQNVLYRLGIDHGAAWHQVFNRGVNGTTWANLDTSEFIADMNVGCMIIKYMINDASFAPAGDSLETFANNIRTKLAAIRAARNVGNLSIILVSGSSANSGGASPQLGNQWFEKAMQVLRRAARDYQCVFVDVYSMMRDNKNALKWMDVTDGASQHTHPGVIMSHWIWGRVADILFNRNVLNLYTRPQSVTPANGWANYLAFSPPLVSRSGGVVSVDGVIGGGAVATGTLLFTMPQGSWPPADLIIPCVQSSGGMVVLKVSSSNGQVTIIAGGAGATWISLSGLRYRIG